MKRIFALAAIAAAAFGCTREQADKQPAPKKQYIIASIQTPAEAGRGGNADFAESEWITPEGRTSLGGDNGRQLLWSAGDQIKVFDGDTYEFMGLFTAEPQEDAASALFSSEAALPLEEGKNYTAFPALLVDDAWIRETHPVNQTQSAAGNSGHIGQSAFIYAQNLSYSASDGLAFSSYSALLEFDIINSGSDTDPDVKLQRISLEDMDGNKTFLNYIEWEPSQSDVFGSAVSLTAADTPSLSATAAKYWMSVTTNLNNATHPGGKQVKVRLQTNKGTRTFTKTIPENGFVGGMLYTATLDWNSGVDETPFSLKWHLLTTSTSGVATCNESPAISPLTVTLSQNLTRTDGTPAGGQGPSWLGGNTFNTSATLTPQDIIDETAYFYTTFTAPAGNAMRLQYIMANVRRPGNGKTKMGVCYSINGGAYKYLTTMNIRENAGEGLENVFIVSSDQEPVVTIPAGASVTLKFVPCSGSGNFFLKNTTAADSYALVISGILI